MLTQTNPASQQIDFQLTDADFRLISEIVYKHSGIALGDQKRDLVQARLAKQIRVSGFNSISQYMRHAISEAGGARYTDLINALSTNLTSFFREPDHFDFLGNEYLPALLPKKSRRRLLAWSAACSSGEEAYTLGITLLESIAKIENVAPPTFRSETIPAGWDVRILATDISTRVLATARAGRYEEQRVQMIPPQFRDRYFSSGANESRHDRHGSVKSENSLYEASPLLRRIIRFRNLNLIDNWPFRGPFDFIFCRNVMIYFDRATQERLVNRFWDLLNPQGLLITGHSESLSGIAHRYKQVRPTIYSKPS